MNFLMSVISCRYGNDRLEACTRQRAVVRVEDLSRQDRCGHAEEGLK